MNFKGNSETCLASLDYLRQNSNSSEAIKLSFAISDQVGRVVEFAPTLDYRNVEANGYRMALYCTAKLIEEAVTKNEDKALSFLRFASFNLKWVLKCCPNAKGLEPLSKESFFEYAKEYLDMNKDLETVLTVFPKCLYQGFAGEVYKLAMTLNAVLTSSGPLQVLRVLLDSKYRHKRSFEALMSLNIGVWKNILNVTDLPIISFLRHCSLALTARDIVFEELFVDITNKWTIGIKGSTFTLISDSLRPHPRPIRCKLLYSKSGAPRKRKLLFHAHGGAYCASTVESHEPYLVRYARQMSDVLIVSIDYTLSPEARFPVQLQETLDVYQWLTSSSCHLFPENCLEGVVVTGDSAAGHLMAALLMVLVDIRELSPRTVTMPLSLVGVYPGFDTQFELLPSQVLGTLETMILPPTALMAMVTALLPSDVTYEGQWWTSESVAANEKLQEMGRLQKHAYFSPLYADEQFVKLADVRLSVIIGSYDLNVDQSVLMAKKWRGQVDFDVLECQAHGFLFFVDTFADSRRAVDLIVQRIKDGFESADQNTIM